MSTAMVAIVASLGGVALLWGLVELAAFWSVERARRAREWLGDRLYGEAMGAGDPVVFLPGLLGSTRYWRPAMDGLLAGWRGIFIDPLGFGRSPWPRGRCGLEEHLRALRVTLVELEATRGVTLVGHSLGAILAAHYAARFGADVRRLVLVGTPVFVDAAQGRERVAAMAPLAALFSFQRLLARASCQLMCAMRPLVRRFAPRMRPDLPAAVMQDATDHSWPSFRDTLEEVVLGSPIAPALDGLGARTVFVHGRRDAITPLEEVRSLAIRLGARLLETGDSHESYMPASAAVIARAVEE